MELKDISPQIAAVARSYQYHKPPDALVLLQEMIADALRLLNDWLASFHITVPGLSDSRMVGNILQVSLYAAGGAAGIALVVAVWARLRELKLQSRLSQKGSASAQIMLDAAGWLKEAESLASAGDYGVACRALYLCLLHLLDEKRISTFVPAKTNYEYWYALAGYPSIQPEFKKLSSIVESIWFGGRPAQQEQYDLCRELLDTTVQGIQALAPVTAEAPSST